MSQSLATRGYIAPSTATGGGGGSGTRLPFCLRDLDGVPAAGVDIAATATVKKLSQFGAAPANVLGTFTATGNGLYYYTPDATEVGTNQWVELILDFPAHQPIRERYDLRGATSDDVDDATTTIANDITAVAASINATVSGVAGAVWDVLRSGHTIVGSFGEGVGVSSVTTAAANTIRDAILNFSHRPGRTVKGWIRRTDAALAGKATGTRSAIARFFAPDGTTKEIEGTQNPGAGTRETPDVSGSES